MPQRSVQHTDIILRDESRGRPVRVDLWSPADGRAAPSGEGAPAVVLSHGAFGAAVNYSWLAVRLAAAGYLVAGVSHFGESFIYGEGTIDPGSILRPWERPPDCSFVLDLLLDGSVFDDVVDGRRIAAVGHSSGGATALELGGAEYDPTAMAEYCSSPQAAGDRGCGYARGAETPLDRDAAVSDAQDARVQAVIALDPALGPGHTDGSLADMAVPVCVVGAVRNDFLPFEQHAARYAASIPGARLVKLDGGEGHFVFLDSATSDSASSGVPLYRDRPGVDRDAVHERLGDTIVGFLAEVL
jgi:predicted dienelactone hydrolase